MIPHRLGRFRGKVQLIFDRTFFPIYKWSVERELFQLAGCFLWLTVFALNGRRTKRLLFFDRAIFRDDLEAMTAYSGRIQYVGISRKYTKVVMLRYISDEEHEGVRYHQNSKISTSRQQVQAAFEKILDTLHRLISFDGLIFPNFNYRDHQEIFILARARRWPSIVVYKEGLLPQSQLDNLFSRHKQDRVNCDLLLCINQRLVDLFKKYGIPGVERACCAAVGIPRLDSYRDVIKAKPKNQLVFFSFYFRDKVRYSKISTARRCHIERISEEFHQNVVQLALDNPDLEVVIKTKISQTYLSYVHGVIEKHFGGSNPLNLTITREGRAIDLIKDSTFVLGGLSTTLIEGILANRKVASPWFPDWFNLENGLFPDAFDGLRYCANYEDLAEFIRTKEHLNKHLGRVAKDTLESLVFTSRFDASTNAEERIVRLLDHDR